MLRTLKFWWALFVAFNFHIVLRSFAVDDVAWYELYANAFVSYILARAFLKYLFYME